MNDLHVTVEPIEGVAVTDTCRFFVLHGGGAEGAERCHQRATHLAVLSDDEMPRLMVEVCTIHGGQIKREPNGLVWANTITEAPYVYREGREQR